MASASEETKNRELVRAYYAAIAHGMTDVEWERWFAPDVIQEEFPNRLLPNGAQRDLRGLREAAERGAALMGRQTFHLLTLVVSGSTVVVEAEWRGQVSRRRGPVRRGYGAAHAVCAGAGAARRQDRGAAQLRLFLSVVGG